MSTLSSNIMQDAMQLEARLATAANQAALGAIQHVSGALGELLDETEKRIAGIKSLKPAVTSIMLPDTSKIDLKQPVSPYLQECISLVSAGLAPVLIGPRGCGKTTTAKQVATALGVPFYGVVFSAAMSKSDIYGSYNAQGYAPSLVIQAVMQASSNTRVLLFVDELDAGNEQMLVALNNLFDRSGSFTNMVNGEQYAFNPDNLLLMAGANTALRGASASYTGRTRLDAATADRFWPISVNYSSELERTIANAYGKEAEALLSFLVGVREKLAELGSEETISTRRIEHIFKAHLIAKLPLDACLASLASGWTEGLAEQAGLLDKPTPKKASRK